MKTILCRTASLGLFILVGSSLALAQDSGGGRAGGGSATTSAIMKLPAKKPSRPTPPKPKPGTRPTAPDNSAQLEDALSLADDARQAGRDEAAERGYMLAAKLVPNDPRSYLGLGYVYYNQKKYVEAEKAYARAAGLSRGDGEAYARLAFTYNELKRPADALAAAQRAVAVQPDSYYGYLALGYIQSLRPNYVDAEAAYRKAVTLAPQPLVVLHTELQRILSDQRKYREAEVEAKRAVEIDPKDYSARFSHAVMLQKLGQLVPSANEYLEAIKLNPKDGAPHSNVGLIYYMAERYPTAREHWTAAISLGSTYDPDRIGLMILDGRLAEARKELETYTQASAGDEDGWLMLGDVYRALGDDSQARVADARAAQIAPEYVGLKRPNLRSMGRGAPVNTPTSTTELFIRRAYMAKTYPAEATQAVTAFLPGDRIIHCIADLNQARPGTPVKFVWKTVQVEGAVNQLIKSVDYTLKEREDQIHGNLSLPRDWPTGTYKVEIYINNALAKTIPYSVR